MKRSRVRELFEEVTEAVNHRGRHHKDERRDRNDWPPV